MPDTEYGRKITAEQAQTIIDSGKDFATARRVLGKDIFDKLPPGSLKTFCTNGFNCFVFSKELITRFFPPQGNADFLMVILGAHDQTDGVFEVGTPTVITAGCKLMETKENGEKVYVSLADDEPANEHPPGTGMVTFPPTGPGEVRPSIVFTVK